MKHKVTLISGDGIGPEVIRATKACVEATKVDIKWEEVEVGELALKKFGCPLPHFVLESIKKNRVSLKGPIITPVAESYRSLNVEIRQRLNLFACLRPAKLYEGIKSRYDNVDIVVVRENTEDLYAGIEFEKDKKETSELIDKISVWRKKTILKDSAISIKPISVFASERIVRFAFDFALKNKRKKVTCIHKANIMKFTDGLFLKSARAVAEDFKGKVEFEEAIVDNMAMQLVLRPQNFDVLVLPNLYGDIISDLCAGLVGGLGVVPGANIGKDIAVFEPVHGAAPKYAGKNRVNPTATILSAVLMLRYLKEDKAAERLENAVKEVIKEGKDVTYDLKEDRNDSTAVGTQEMASAIIKKIR